MTENILIKNLTLLERNPRKITKEQMSKLCKSIEEDPEFLNNRPVLVNCVDGKNIVYAGNQRVRAAKQLKMKTIPCVIEKDLPDELVKKRMLKDNLHTGEWDFEIIANEYDVDFLLDAGFTEFDLQIHAEDEKEEKPDQEAKESKVKFCPHCNGVL